MTKGLKSLQNILDRMLIALIETRSMVDMHTIEKELRALEIIEKDFKISVYHTRHNESGYEMCIEDIYGNCIYKPIAESEYETMGEILKWQGKD